MFWMARVFGMCGAHVLNRGRSAAHVLECPRCVAVCFSWRCCASLRVECLGEVLVLEWSSGVLVWSAWVECSCGVLVCSSCGVLVCSSCGVLVWSVRVEFL